jgi:Family of unknown function (DUF5808)
MKPVSPGATAGLMVGLAVFIYTRVVKQRRTGTLFRIPFSWEPPTRAAIRHRVWNPADRRLFTPHVFGWGWSINGYELLRRLGLVSQASGRP